MVYVIIITFSISQVIQAGLAIYLFLQLQRYHPMLETYTIAMPSAPLFDNAVNK
jgi:hypothetical protein